MRWTSSVDTDGQPLLETRGGDRWFRWTVYQNGKWWRRGIWIGRKRDRDAAYRLLESWV